MSKLQRNQASNLVHRFVNRKFGLDPSRGLDEQVIQGLSLDVFVHGLIKISAFDENLSVSARRISAKLYQDFRDGNCCLPSALDFSAPGTVSLNLWSSAMMTQGRCSS